ncbi:uncharacterized protein LOC130936249 isoform X1 [Arachis stenosperma]|uniref:uncharacterized protein LOC130936249 isoform X1 n=1 Tax=Arachis stenosperma TaxID=217475 RepID=UPI0025AC11F6|nr:uncharacterized protein LOC130936249 isoform X1 [Arachis stenosperma]
MRIKTRGGRRRLSCSADPPSPITKQHFEQDEYVAAELEISHGGGGDDAKDAPMVDCIDQHYNENHLDVLNHEQDKNCATEFETSHGGGDDDNVKDVPTVECIDQHYNENPLDILDHEDIDFLDKSICLCCNKRGGVLVCSGSGCPVGLHPKCINSEPKFDDLGKFYCPYCWYSRNVNMNPELKERIFSAKNALLGLSDKDVVMNDRLVKTKSADKRKEPDDGGGIPLSSDGRQGTDEVGAQLLQPKVDLPIKLQKDASVQCDIALEDQAYSDGDFRSCGEEVMPVDINLVEGSLDQDKFDRPGKVETDETKSLELKESFEIGDSRLNKEDVHERIINGREEGGHLDALHLGKHIEGHSKDIAFAQGTQESSVKSGDKGRKTGKEKMPLKENEESAIGSSVNETNNSDSDTISGRSCCSKRKIQKTEYPQDVYKKPLLQGNNFKEEKGSDINEEVTSCRFRRRSQSSQKQEIKKFPLARRNMLIWTAEEEKILQEGVLRFSKENQRIPWNRILEFGRHVFDKTRSPIDLKDKWRNIKKGQNKKQMNG